MFDTPEVSATYSIAARDERTGLMGVAVASRAFAVGALCPFVRARVGAISIQAYNNPRLGYQALKLLEEGYSAKETLEKLVSDDDGHDWRQLLIVDYQGRSAVYTGNYVDPWKGFRTGPNYAIGGNLLVGESTLLAMEEAFLENSDQEFGEQLIRVLEAGDRTGGDRRGKQAGAIFIVYHQPFPYLDLRVDDHSDPVQELRRLVNVAKESGFLEFTYRLSDTLEPRSKDENLDRQQKLRKQFHISE
jgi:uncharacterized Ntn-hydrolase superfamily protein